jgi:hypothetical protein
LQELTGKSEYPNTQETDVLLTVDQAGSLFYIVFISPASDYPNAWPVYDQVIQSIRFKQ